MLNSKHTVLIMCVLRVFQQVMTIYKGCLLIPA